MSPALCFKKLNKSEKRGLRWEKIVELTIVTFNDIVCPIPAFKNIVIFTTYVLTFDDYLGPKGKHWEVRLWHHVVDPSQRIAGLMLSRNR